MDHAQERLFNPGFDCLVATAKRDVWGYWTLTITCGYSTNAGTEWAPSDRYTDLTRAEVGDVLLVVGEQLSEGR